jgi:hypothetical protein
MNSHLPIQKSYDPRAALGFLSDQFRARPTQPALEPGNKAAQPGLCQLPIAKVQRQSRVRADAQQDTAAAPPAYLPEKELSVSVDGAIAAKSGDEEFL